MNLSIKGETQKYLYAHPHSSCTHESQAAEAPSVSRWTNKYGLSMQWNITQPWKGRSFWHTPQHGWTLKACRWVKQASHEGQILWSHLPEASGDVKITENVEESLLGSGAGGGVTYLIALEFPFCKMQSWRWLGVMDTHNMNVLYALNCVLKNG